MATGVHGREKNGPDSLRASQFHREPHPLPSSSAAVVLSYPGKLDEQEVMQPAPTCYHAFGRDGELARDVRIVPNAVVLSDNFYALHHLLRDDAKVDLIYLDPPFGTGMDFQSRQLMHAYADKLGEAAYVEFMRRRLILLREVLAADGSIYLHIGHQMVGHLKAVMDEIFGRRNFRNVIVRRKCSSKNFTSRQYANIHDYILFYTRSARYKWNQPGEKPSADWIEREYPKCDARGRYKLVPVHAPGARNGETGKPWRGMMPPPGKHWQYTPAKLDELDAAGKIHWSCNGNPRRKVYLESDKTVALTDYWARFRDAHHQSIRVTGYPTEKNLDLLKLVVAASSDPGDRVLDPFCGSGTTLQAAGALGREWIGVDESIAAVRATLRRLRHGSGRMGDYVERNTPAEPAEVQQSLFSDADTCEAIDLALYVDAELACQREAEVRAVATT